MVATAAPEQGDQPTGASLLEDKDVVRRPSRSRGKRPPPKVVHADASAFRALVQQLTSTDAESADVQFKAQRTSSQSSEDLAVISPPGSEAKKPRRDEAKADVRSFCDFLGLNPSGADLQGTESDFRTPDVSFSNWKLSPKAPATEPEANPPTSKHICAPSVAVQARQSPKATSGEPPPAANPSSFTPPKPKPKGVSKAASTILQSKPVHPIAIRSRYSGPLNVTPQYSSGIRTGTPKFAPFPSPSPMSLASPLSLMSPLSARLTSRSGQGSPMWPLTPNSLQSPGSIAFQDFVLKVQSNAEKASAEDEANRLQQEPPAASGTLA